VTAAVPDSHKQRGQTAAYRCGDTYDHPDFGLLTCTRRANHDGYHMTGLTAWSPRTVTLTYAPGQQTVVKVGE
jgi:hypothetical protein